MYELVLTRKAQKFYEQADESLAERLNRCFEQLQANPYNHPNIKRLRGSLSGCGRYRVGDWRVVYRVDEAQHSVTVLLIAHRREVYQ
ncbi:MAG TPA: type II toxin-antitoxin system RelE/ParE family toxin [Candidatus Sericytochromatia bacterium]|jgi:mRNA interferase RelE/StbE